VRLRPFIAVRLLIGVKGKSLVPKRDAKVQAALTYREQQVLEHITKGYTNQEIAERLGLTIGTIKYYLSQLFKKLHVRNRVQAVLAAKNQNS
jgi:DNA-binding NarL/FixJ family response regulator